MTQNWIYIDPIHPEDWVGFIYKITNKTNGKFYIGKKVFWNNRKTKLTKKEIAEQTGPGRKPTHKVVTKESDWLTYWGSNKDLLADIQELGMDNFERKILTLCKSKKELTYWEMHYQCKEEVLLVDAYNDNILGKFFTQDLVS